MAAARVALKATDAAAIEAFMVKYENPNMYPKKMSNQRSNETRKKLPLNE